MNQTLSQQLESQPELIRPVVVAELLNVSRKTPYAWASEGKVTAVKFGNRCMRIYKHSLIEFVEQSEDW